ncbi:MAG: cation:proton antiporter [Bacteroidia bacterium]|nr:cation:proton antiporter [Bacteroidia bacterium]
MLILARLLSEIGRKFKLPVVMGELIVGILLGPTVFGQISPDLFSVVFPNSGGLSLALHGITSLSVVMLLFVAGMEVQMPLVLQQGKLAMWTSFFSMLIPFISGFAVAYYFPNVFGVGEEHKILFSSFMGTAMSITALPVIARILMDMNLFKTKLGMIIIASAMFNDLVGWLIFSVILAMMTAQGATVGVLATVGYIVLFGLFMLTVGKKLIDKALPWVQNKLAWPGGVLSISLGLCFLAAAFTENIGIHAILGSFIMGIAIGDSVQLREEAREIIHQFVTNIFAPLFFVSIGLQVNFITNFDWKMVTLIVSLAYVCKVVGAGIGARIGGLSKNESLVVGFGMNARGAMEIILGTLALNAQLINSKVFVGLVVMALLTSLTSAPLMRKFLPQND